MITSSLSVMVAVADAIADVVTTTDADIVTIAVAAVDADVIADANAIANTYRRSRSIIATGPGFTQLR